MQRMPQSPAVPLRSARNSDNHPSLTILQQVQRHVTQELSTACYTAENIPTQPQEVTADDHSLHNMIVGSLA